jgi:modulator of FtsH protease
MQTTGPIVRSNESVLATNKVLRNTYMLLAMTLLFSAAMAGTSMALDLGRGVGTIAFFASLALVWFVLPRVENSSAGIYVVFAFTGLLGLSIGPTVEAYLSIPNGSSIVATALGGTGTIFLGLSAYVLVTKKDFSFMGGFLFIGLLVAIVAMIANFFLQIPALSMALSAAIVLIMSGFILFDTSRIINGGETNYIRATVGLFLSIYNIFQGLLMLLGMGDE